MWMTFNHLKTISTKLARYRLKIRKVIEFFDIPFTTHYLYNYVLVVVMVSSYEMMVISMGIHNKRVWDSDDGEGR